MAESKTKIPWDYTVYSILFYSILMKAVTNDLFKFVNEGQIHQYFLLMQSMQFQACYITFELLIHLVFTILAIIKMCALLFKHKNTTAVL